MPRQHAPWPMVTCTYCAARPGDPCTKLTDRSPTNVHRQRTVDEMLHAADLADTSNGVVIDFAFRHRTRKVS